MKTIDKYLISNLSKFFCLGLIAFLCLYIFIDLFDKIFRFDHIHGIEKLKLLVKFYLYSLPGLFEYISPFIFSLCCFFSLSKLEQNSQIVAINASGVSIFRLLETLFITSLILGILIFFSSEKLTPEFITKKKKIEKPELFQNLSKKSINFRDKIAFQSFPKPEMLNFKRSLDFIDIEQIDLNKRKSGSFHATLFDNNHIPRLKIYASSCNWTEDQSFILKNGFYFNYKENNILDHKNIKFQTLKIKLNVPIYSVFLSTIDLKALEIGKLKYFFHNKEAYSEFFFRLIYPFFPFLMLLVAFAIGLPMLFRRPIYSYFYCLASCFYVFLVGNYLKNEMIINSMSAFWSAVIITLPCLFIYILGKNKIPT